MRDPDEAWVALRAGADLIDAKDPGRGALGALPPATVAAIVRRIGGAAATSAVAEPWAAEVAAAAGTGVGWVKVGLAPALWADAPALAALAAAAPGRLIGVLFAEDAPGADLAPRLAAAGFAGAMIDTASKAGARLTDLVGAARLADFTAACRAAGLVSGLAGSLRVSDIPALALCRPDYLGFRGGLCLGLDRGAGLDPARVAAAARALARHRWAA